MVIREPRSGPGEVRVTEPPMSSMSCEGEKGKSREGRTAEGRKTHLAGDSQTETATAELASSARVSLSASQKERSEVSLERGKRRARTHRKGTKRVGRTSLLMPTPVSSTANSTMTFASVSSSWRR
jgi:cytoskeletal protein RodZ